MTVSFIASHDDCIVSEQSWLGQPKGSMNSTTEQKTNTNTSTSPAANPAPEVKTCHTCHDVTPDAVTNCFCRNQPLVCLACIRRATSTDSRCPTCREDITTITDSNGRTIPVAYARQPVQPIAERADNSSDDERQEGQPEEDPADVSPGAEPTSPVDIPLSTLRFSAQSRRRRNLPPRRSTTAAPEPPAPQPVAQPAAQPVPAASADRYYTVQSQLELAHDTIMSILSTTNAHDLSTFGEHKTEDMPTYRDYQTFRANINVKVSAFEKRLRKVAEELSKRVHEHTDIAMSGYVCRTSAEMERNRQRVQAEIASRQAQADRLAQEIAAFQAQLPGSTRPRQRQRRS